MQNAQPSILSLSPSEISPEMAERLAAELPEADLTKLKDLMAQQRKLDSVREVIMARMEKANSKMEQDAQQLSVREKCQLVGEVQECLYELQLCEHASKVPLLEITKIFFSHNPKRCLRKDASPTKQKPPKRRKNELGGLISNIDFGKKFSAREAKLLAASQVQQQNDGRTDEFSGKKGSGGQTAGRLTKRRTVRAVKSTPTVGMSPVHSGWLEREEYQGAEAPEMRSMAVEHHIPPAEEDDLNLVLMHSPSPLADESPLASLQRTDSTNNVASATSQMHSPPGTRSRKKGGGGKGENQSDAGSTGGKSPRKRSGVVERQRHGSGTKNASAKEPTDELDEEEQPIPADEPTYCLCEQVSFGEMICCDYELCSVEWFHFACVNIKSKPKGKKWFCPLCRYNDKANLLKPELHQKLEQMRRREGQ